MPSRRQFASESAVVTLPDFRSLETIVPFPAIEHVRAETTSPAFSYSSSHDPEPESELSSLSSSSRGEKPKPKRQRKPRAPKPEPVYEIPDVASKPYSHIGVRYGYACLNTVLRNKRPAKDAVFCSRTLRLATLQKMGVEYTRELGLRNARDLIKLVEWNEENNIRFLRVSSDLFPFASHPEHGYRLDFAAGVLKEAGDLAKKYGHRLTSHPGQFTQLGSPRKVVVDNAFRDLKYHCEMFDLMGMGKDSVMIIHGGGTFGDKSATIQRIKENYQRLPDNVKERLVLENDEICYNADDLLPVCEELNIPFVFDYHHDWLYPSSQTPAEMMPRILATWKRKGIRPKQHLSEPRPGAETVMERRAHSDRIKSLPEALPDHVDLMLEAKDKEQAVLELYRIYEIEPVIHENLRPPANVETLQTKGRKSHQKKKLGEAEEGAEEPTSKRRRRKPSDGDKEAAEAVTPKRRRKPGGPDPT